MLLFWLETSYLLGLVAWTGCLAAFLVWLLKRRRTIRLKRPAGARLPSKRLNAIFMGLWFLLASLTFAEAIFALAVDHSEAFNASLIAKRWFARHIDAQRNADGFRERRILSDRLPPNVRRILFLGDSFTAGHGIKNMDDRFTERLEFQLNAAAKPGWQIYNMGEPGYEISMIRALNEAVLSRDHAVDMVIYCYMMNDIEGYDPRTQTAIEEISQRRRSGNWLVEHSYFSNWLYHRWVQYAAGSSVDYFPHLVDSYAGTPWLAVVHDLNDMVARSREKNVPFRLVIFPFMHNLGPEYPFHEAHEKLAVWAHEHDVPVLDMKPVFEACQEEKLVVNRFDNHPNERAHALIAEELIKWIRADDRPAETSNSAAR